MLLLSGKLFGRLWVGNHDNIAKITVLFISIVHEVDCLSFNF